MNLKLYKKFQYYNFYDILISLSLLYVKFLVTRDKQSQNSEYAKIAKEYEQLFSYKPRGIEEVIEKIQEVSSEGNVSMCKKLEKSQAKFKWNVRNQIDQFGEIIYTSSYIPIVTRLQ